MVSRALQSPQQGQESLKRPAWEARAQLSADLGIPSGDPPGFYSLALQVIPKKPRRFWIKVRIFFSKVNLGCHSGACFLADLFRNTPSCSLARQGWGGIVAIFLEAMLWSLCLISVWPGSVRWPRGRGWAWWPKVSLSQTAHFCYPQRGWWWPGKAHRLTLNFLLSNNAVSTS